MVHIQYCMGCQYNKHFQDVKNELEMYNIATVTGANYPLSPARNLASWGVTILQWGIIILMMNGDSIFQATGVTPPSIYYRMVEKKWMVGIAAWMLGNQLNSAIGNSGAFEVYCDGALVFSRLATNQMPDAKYLAGLIR